MVLYLAYQKVYQFAREHMSAVCILELLADVVCKYFSAHYVQRCNAALYRSYSLDHAFRRTLGKGRTSKYVQGSATHFDTL